jgi:hypothetical protein
VPESQVTTHPTASPEPSVTATPTPNPDSGIVTGPPSAPVHLAVIKEGTIVNNQVIGGDVIIQGSISEYTNQMVADNGGIVTPATMNEIAWWSGGGEPGANPTNTPPAQSTQSGTVAPRFTSYVYGHSWIEDAIFNLLRTLEPGSDVILQVTTANGYIYAYELTDSFHVAKKELGNDPRVTEDVVNRFVTISCYRPDGYPDNAATVDNIVGIWQMTAVLSASWAKELPPDEEKIGVEVHVGVAHAE